MNINPATASMVMPKPVTWSGGSWPMGGSGAHQRMDAAVTASAKLFGMSTDDLKKALDSGQSLTDVAASKGISSATLVSTIAQAIGTVSSTGSKSGATDPASNDLSTQIAQRIAGHHRRHGAATAAAAPATSSAAAPAPAANAASDPDGDGDNDAKRSSGFRAYL